MRPVVQHALQELIESEVTVRLGADRRAWPRDCCETPDGPAQDSVDPGWERRGDGSQTGEGSAPPESAGATPANRSLLVGESLTAWSSGTFTRKVAELEKVWRHLGVDGVANPAGHRLRARTRPAQSSVVCVIDLRLPGRTSRPGTGGPSGHFPSRRDCRRRDRRGLQLIALGLNVEDSEGAEFWTEFLAGLTVRALRPYLWPARMRTEPLRRRSSSRCEAFLAALGCRAAGRRAPARPVLTGRGARRVRAHNLHTT